MSSNSIYPHVPYFYVIEHVASSKRYAGCRYAKGCNPAEFMTEDGYCTSSSTVKQIIEDDGIDAFVVVEIKTIDEVGDVYDYETKFLTENDCAASEQWLNHHNNTGMTFGTEEFKAAMFSKHGVEHALHSELCKEQKRQTMLKNHDVEHAMQSEEIKEKYRQTCLKNHSVEYPMQSEEIKEKSKKSCIDRYGFEYSLQSEEIKEKGRRTMFSKYRVENASQSDEIKERKQQTCMRNHGVNSALQLEEVREKSRLAMFNQYGVEYPFQSISVREKSKQTCLKNYGVENPCMSEEFQEKIRKTVYKKFDSKINNEILNGNFSRFVYLYDTVENVFLMGIENCLNRGANPKRYVKITGNKGSKKYIDTLTGKTYQINPSLITMGLPENFSPNL